jgi:hypothetical protein
MCFEFDEYDQTGTIAFLYQNISEKTRLAIFGEPKEPEELPLTSYRFMILDISEDAQNNNTSSSLSV